MLVRIGESEKEPPFIIQSRSFDIHQKNYSACVLNLLLEYHWAGRQQLAPNVGRQLLARLAQWYSSSRFRTQALYFFWCISKLIDCIMTTMTSLTFTKRGSFSDSPILTNIIYSFQVIIRCHYFRYVKGTRALHYTRLNFYQITLKSAQNTTQNATSQHSW